MKAELQRRQTNLDRVEAEFKAYPARWINALDFERVGGRQAWRSRIAECRTKRGMFIENRLDKNALGQVVASWYRYLPQGKPLGRDPRTPDLKAEKHPPVVQTLFDVRPRA